MATARPSLVSTKMEPPPPVSRCSAAATAALEHLQGVEKQLQNEGLVFDMGTVQHLEEAIKAIKKLEGERKRILELLEEETIKNCNLRVKVKGMPQIVMEEFEALVAAARRGQILKITEIEASAQEVESVVERTHSKQNLSEQRNLALSEEQKEFGDKQEKAVELLNQQLATKNSFYIHVNELLNMERDEEEESVFQINANDELEKEIAQAVSAFEEEQALLDSQTVELQSKLKALELQIAQKKTEYEALMATLRDLEKQVEEKKQAIHDGREELAKLFEAIKRLLKEYERKKAEKEGILQKKAELQTGLTSMDSNFHEEAEALLQQLAEAEEERISALQIQKKRKNENDLLRTQFELLFQEERKFNTRRNYLAKEFERLSNEVTEKLDRLTKRLVEIQNVNEEQEKMEDMLGTADDSYQREILSLEYSLQREAERSKMVQDQLEDLLAQYKKLQSNHKKFMSRTHEKTETGQRMFVDLVKQNEVLEKEMGRTEAYEKILHHKYDEKAALFKQFNASVTDELRKLEDEYNAMLELLQEQEAKVSMDLPVSETLQVKFKKESNSYDSQRSLYMELQAEETTLNKSIARSIKEISRLRRLKVHLRGEINTQREAANQHLKTLLGSVKYLERDIYEVNRRLYSVDAENARFRKAIAYLRADISTLETEAETYRSERLQIREEVKALHIVFDRRWSEDKHLLELYLKEEHKALKALEEHIERVKERNGKVNYVSDGLQLNYEGLAFLVKSKPTVQESFAITA